MAPVARRRSGFDTCVERVWCTMRAVLVVVGAEGVEVGLEHSRGRRRRLFGEELLGMVEALDLAAGLGVIRS